jgi:hypothetical protein
MDGGAVGLGPLLHDVGDQSLEPSSTASGFRFRMLPQWHRLRITKKERTMYARVTTLQVPMDKAGEAEKYFKEQVVPNFKQMRGFQRAFLLADKKTGKAHGVFLFDTEDNLKASAQRASELREKTIESLGARVLSVEEMEVIAES